MAVAFKVAIRVVMRVVVSVIVSLAISGYAPSLSMAHAQSATDAGRALIGFVEEFELPPADSDAATMTTAQVRLGFIRDANGWLPVCTIAGMEGDRAECTEVGAEGLLRLRILPANPGASPANVTIETRGFYAPERPHLIGMLRLANPSLAALPDRGAASAAFAGWMGGEVRRPQVVRRMAGTTPGQRAMAPPSVSPRIAHRVAPRIAPNWREASPRPADWDAMTKVFQQVMPQLPDCRAQTAMARPLAVSPSMAVTPDKLRVIGAYESSAGERLVGLQLDRALTSECDGVLGQEWSDFWLLAGPDNGLNSGPNNGPNNGPRLLNFGHVRDQAVRMRVVAIADLDGDGHNEVVFWQATLNEDGYVLVYDSFKSAAKAIWSYH